MSNKPYAVTVFAGNDTITGYLIRSDAILIAAPDELALPLAVEFPDGHRVDVIGVHFTASLSVDGYPLCALRLPDGTAEVDGELPAPPDLVEPEKFDPMHSPARRSIWCRMFPRLRGC